LENCQALRSAGMPPVMAMSRLPPVYSHRPRVPRRARATQAVAGRTGARAAQKARTPGRALGSSPSYSFMLLRPSRASGAEATKQSVRPRMARPGWSRSRSRCRRLAGGRSPHTRLWCPSSTSAPTARCRRSAKSASFRYSRGNDASRLKETMRRVAVG